MGLKRGRLPRPDLRSTLHPSNPVLQLLVLLWQTLLCWRATEESLSQRKGCSGRSMKKELYSCWLFLKIYPLSFQISDYLKTDLLMPEISSRIRAWKGGFLSILYSPKSCLFIFSDSEWKMCSLNSYPSFFYFQRFKNASQNITSDQMPHSARMCHRFTEACLC